jgi:NAD(P)-dependent dehydrogenase (short-subunit alcohol dehydrogenase family)
MQQASSCAPMRLGTDDDAWQRIMGVNVSGTFYMCRAALKHFTVQRSGAIVNFGSIWGGVGGRGHVAYCASKGAVHQLTRAMALDHARDGIRINAVCPGEVDTPMIRSARSYTGQRRGSLQDGRNQRADGAHGPARRDRPRGALPGLRRCQLYDRRDGGGRRWLHCDISP